MNLIKVLVVDDEPDIREIVRIYLENEGYQVVEATNGQEVLSLLEQQTFELAIIDVMMPGMDGIQLCMRIRSKYNLPVLMLSAKNQDIDKVMGLTAGADDYLAKPFNPVELLARVKAQLRRYRELNPNSPVDQKLVYGELTLLLEDHKLLKNGEVILLTPTEFSILELLWKNKNVVFSTDRIYDRIWGEEEFEVDNTVMVHIRNLRNKIEDKGTPEKPKKPFYIKTVWGIGYKFGE